MPFIIKYIFIGIPRKYAMPFDSREIASYKTHAIIKYKS